ncbi:MAG: LamG-like jellyroll fold domain-containing protein [Paludibacter sp.]
MKKIYSFAIALLVTCSMNAQTLLYSNNFESGVGTSTIVGNGQIEVSQTPGFGSVFHNAAGGQGVRSNYLLLPTDIFANLQTSGVKELSIAFWVNKSTAVDNFWTPMFSAYGAAPAGGINTWPMMILQSRLVAQVNCSGWTDLVDADNINALNLVSTTWLDDAAWHYYAATFTETAVKIYVDGILQNAWTLNGTDGHTVAGLFSGGSGLTYICLGGNQAWNWNDPDPAYMYDDLSIYSSALTPEQITATMDAKVVTDIKTISNGNAVPVSEEFFSITGAKVGYEYTKLPKGIYIKKAIYSNGVILNTKIEKVVAQ